MATRPYDPIGGLNGMFAPAFLRGDQPSEDAVAAWLAKNLRKRPVGDQWGGGGTGRPDAGDTRDAIAAAMMSQTGAPLRYAGISPGEGGNAGYQDLIGQPPTDIAPPGIPAGVPVGAPVPDDDRLAPPVDVPVEEEPTVAPAPPAAVPDRGVNITVGPPPGTQNYGQNYGPQIVGNDDESELDTSFPSQNYGPNYGPQLGAPAGVPGNPLDAVSQTVPFDNPSTAPFSMGQPQTGVSSPPMFDRQEEYAPFGLSAPPAPAAPAAVAAVPSPSFDPQNPNAPMGAQTNAAVRGGFAMMDAPQAGWTSAVLGDPAGAFAPVTSSAPALGAFTTPSFDPTSTYASSGQYAPMMGPHSAPDAMAYGTGNTGFGMVGGNFSDLSGPSSGPLGSVFDQSNDYGAAPVGGGYDYGDSGYGGYGGYNDYGGDQLGEAPGGWGGGYAESAAADAQAASDAFGGGWGSDYGGAYGTGDVTTGTDTAATDAAAAAAAEAAAASGGWEDGGYGGGFY